MIGSTNNPRNSRSPGGVRLGANGPAHRAAVNREARSTRRRGYILIIVLGLTAIISTLGLSFLNAHSTVMPEAVNRFRATRARYLAESGVDIATHFLLYPPTTVSADGYWPGANGIAVDGTSDYTDVAVQQDAGDPNQFTVTALGVAHDFDGTTVVGKQTVTAQVLRPFDGKWRIPYGYLARGLAILPATVQVLGDVHSNNALLGNGWCQGNVSAAGAASWPGSGPPASVSSMQPVFTPPPADSALYAAYSIKGKDYTAHALGRRDLTPGQANAVNAIDMSLTNPGRILLADPGDFTLRSAATLTGTLVVAGDLKFHQNTLLTAVANYPALVVTGDIVADKDEAKLTVIGSVICGGSILDRGRPNVFLSVRGACTAGTFDLSRGDGTYIFRWDPAYSVFWNLAESEAAYPATLLDWKEN